MQKSVDDASPDSIPTSPSRLYCYLDESGDFDFGENGSEYYFQSALVTDTPFPLLEGMQRTKYQLYADHLPLSKSHGNNDYFHATEDAPYTRARTYAEIERHCDEFAIYTICVKKSRTPLEKRDSRTFYQMVFKNLIGKVIDAELVADRYSSILVLTDRIPVQRHRRAIIGSLKKSLSIALEGSGVTYTVADMDSKSDFGLQAADCCTWAVHRLWTHGDSTYYTRLQSAYKPTIIQYPAGIPEP